MPNPSATTSAFIDALRTQLGDDIATLHENIPNKITPPSVIVTPGDPFLTPATHGLIEERWDVLVAMNRTSPDRGVAGFRELSMAVMSAAHSIGAIWEETSGPRTVGDGDSSYVLVVNKVRLKYAPADLADESSS